MSELVVLETRRPEPKLDGLRKVGDGSDPEDRRQSRRRAACFMKEVNSVQIRSILGQLNDPESRFCDQM